MKPEYHEGPKTWQKFEDGMRKLFQAPKLESPFTPPAPKPKEAPGKD